MKRVAYKFKHIRWKFDVKQNLTDCFKFKQQKSFISFNITTKLLILQDFSNPLRAPVFVQPCHLLLLF